MVKRLLLLWLRLLLRRLVHRQLRIVPSQLLLRASPAPALVGLLEQTARLLHVPQVSWFLTTGGSHSHQKCILVLLHIAVSVYVVIGAPDDPQVVPLLCPRCKSVRVTEVVATENVLRAIPCVHWYNGSGGSARAGSYNTCRNKLTIK